MVCVCVCVCARACVPVCVCLPGLGEVCVYRWGLGTPDQSVQGQTTSNGSSSMKTHLKPRTSKCSYSIQKEKKKYVNPKVKKANQPTTGHPKMTATDVWASASVLCFLFFFLNKVQNQREASFLSHRNDYMTILKKPQVL